MKLYSGVLSVFGIKAEIAALEKGLAVDVELVPFSVSAGYEPKHPQVLRINPKHEVPVLADGDLELFDSTQIFEYFEHLKPKPPLWPAEARERARARLLELRIDEVFFPNVVQLFPKNRAAADDATIERAQLSIRDFYEKLERSLRQDRAPYLAGDFGYADIAWLAAQFMAEAVGVPLTPAHECLVAWRRSLLSRPSATPVHRAVEYLAALGLTVYTA